MSLGRLATVLAATAALAISGGCFGKLVGSSTAPDGGGGRGANFTVDGGSPFVGAMPAPILVDGVTYVYLNSGSTGDGTVVARSSDGVNFTNTPATYPVGISRSIVKLP